MRLQSVLLVTAVANFSRRAAGGCRGNECRSALSYRCHNIKGDAYRSEDADTPAATRHRLLEASEGKVVHVNAETAATGWTVARQEIVDALLVAEDGGDNFEAMSKNGTTTHFFDLKRDGMALSAEEGDERALAKAFSVANAFVTDAPDVEYRVACPAAGAEECHVTADEHDGGHLVDCTSEEGSFLAEHVPGKCRDEVYDVGMYFSPGPHFSLAGVAREPGAGRGCPPSIVMQSIDGQKKKHAVIAEDLARLPRHDLGTASLGDLLRAEENAKPIYDAAFDALANTCVHYAGDIARPLEVPETEELARFLTEHIVNDANAEVFFKKAGGVRALAAVTIGGKGALERHIAKIVRSQLNIPPVSDGTE